jgi:dihydroorotate dehydrogenase electron transfer subunit
MTRLQSAVVTNSPLGGNFHEMTFSWDTRDEPLPGQFLTVRVSSTPVPLLRRPFAFSAYDQRNKTVSIIFKIRGTATDLLSRKRAGESVDLIGPLGKAFPNPHRGQHAFVIAGGIGLGPMLFLTQALRRGGYSATLLFGARSRLVRPQLKILGELDAVICTDDGSEGFRGTPLDYMKGQEDLDPNKVVLYGCGPIAMLEAAHRLAASHGTMCWVSMEQHMGCSLGACMGCVVRIVNPPGYARVCTEGPVFDSREIKWT